MTQMEKEWRWEAYESSGWFREHLIWRGIILASVEGSGDRWFGNLGSGHIIEDWKFRMTHQPDRAKLKERVEAAVVALLREALK